MKEKEYVAYLAPNNTVLLDWGDDLWTSGYPFCAKHKCIEIERGISEGGMKLVKIHARLERQYCKEE